MRGACVCGHVAFEVEGLMRPVVACHCTQCRKWSGHYWAAASVPMRAFRLLEAAGLAWYRASSSAARGFCRDCGASLFWKPDDEDRMSFSPASLDGAARLAIHEHIFTGDAGDYYSPEGPPPAPAPVSGPLQASCLCGAARFTLPGPAGEVTACHCTQCRKISGHYSASFDVEESGIIWEARTSLREHRTPAGGTRGFCSGCGSSLWFRAADGAFSVEAGCINGATGGTLTNHIFTADRGDYYSLDDGLPQSPSA